MSKSLNKILIVIASVVLVQYSDI